MKTTRLHTKPGLTVRCVRTRAVMVVAACVLVFGWPTPGRSQDADWLGANGDYNDGTNWTGGAEPTGIATFGSLGENDITFSNSATIGEWTFTVGAQNYDYTIGRNRTLTFTGKGITGETRKATIENNRGVLDFSNMSSAGTATINNTRGFTLIPEVDCAACIVDGCRTGRAHIREI
ncbi:MAG: hypothetical protein AAGF09_02445 [Pseudomonadota bacterium]